MNIKFLLTLLLISVNIFSQQQENKETDSFEVKIDNTFFLLGTLNDYMGRKFVVKGEIFDRYFQNERPLMQFVDSIVKNEFGITMTEDKYCLNSEIMSKKMNSFYSENNLIDSLFSSKEKKVSFLLGAYYRYGEKVNDNIYKIRMANSFKHIQIQQFLLSLGCKNVYYKRLDNIPVQNTIYFEANELIKKYFQKVEVEKEKLFQSQFEYLKDKKITREDLIKEMNKNDYKIIEFFNQK